MAWAKPDEIEIKLVANRTDEADQVLMLLLCALLVTLPVNKPCNLSIRPELGAQLFGAQARSPHKVCPPMIVRKGLVLFPLIHRRAAHQNDVFTRSGWRGLRDKGEDREKNDEQ